MISECFCTLNISSSHGFSLQFFNFRRYKWNFSGLSLDKRLEFFESNWAFFAGFGNVLFSLMFGCISAVSIQQFFWLIIYFYVAFLLFFVTRDVLRLM